MQPTNTPPATAGGVGDDEIAERARLQYASDDAVRALDIELVRVWPGGAEMRMTIAETMLNAHRIGHGGYVFLLADTTFAYAFGTRVTSPVTRNADVAFLAPSGAGDRLTAVARETSSTGRNAVYDVTVRRDSGQVVGEFRFHGTTPSRPIAATD